MESDPEIVELKKELRLVRLEQQLAEVKSPSRSEGHGLLTVEVHRETLRLYHAVMATVQAMDLNYHATMGEWLRDVAFKHAHENPGFVDLRHHFSDDELKSIFGERA